MTMNHADAQTFFDCSSKSFSQLRAIFAALEDATKDGISNRISGLIGAGIHISEGMSETVGCWADEAAEPWLEDQDAQATSEIDSHKANGTNSNEFIHELCGIKTLIDSAERAIWQEGSPASDRALVMDAVYLLQDASNKVSKAIDKT